MNRLSAVAGPMSSMDAVLSSPSTVVMVDCILVALDTILEILTNEL